MSASTHFALEQLADFVADRLSPEARADIEKHLETGCLICSAEVVLLRRIARAMQVETWLALPKPIHRRAVSAFSSSGFYRPRTHLRWRPLIAAVAIMTLTFGLVFALWPRPVVYAGAIAESVGPVEMQLTTQSVWKPITVGQAIPRGASLRTGAGGQATLLFTGGDQVHLMDNATLLLKSLLQAEGQWQMVWMQSSGRVEYWVRSQIVRYAVQSIAGEISAGASHFTITLGEAGEMTIGVTEGALRLRTDQTTMDLSAGAVVQVAPGSAPVFIATTMPETATSAPASPTLASTTSATTSTLFPTNVPAFTPATSSSPSGTPVPPSPTPLMPTMTDIPTATASPTFAPTVPPAPTVTPVTDIPTAMANPTFAPTVPPAPTATPEEATAEATNDSTPSPESTDSETPLPPVDGTVTSEP